MMSSPQNYLNHLLFALHLAGLKVQARVGSVIFRSNMKDLSTMDVFNHHCKIHFLAQSLGVQQSQMLKETMNVSVQR